MELDKLPKRICPDCPGMVFPTIGEHVDHLTSHNPSPAQWHDAYVKILQSREKDKDRAKRSSST